MPSQYYNKRVDGHSVDEVLKDALRAFRPRRNVFLYNANHPSIEMLAQHYIQVVLQLITYEVESLLTRSTKLCQRVKVLKSLIMIGQNTAKKESDTWS